MDEFFDSDDIPRKVVTSLGEWVEDSAFEAVEDAMAEGELLIKVEKGRLVVSFMTINGDTTLFKTRDLLEMVQQEAELLSGRRSPEETEYADIFAQKLEELAQEFRKEAAL